MQAAERTNREESKGNKHRSNPHRMQKADITLDPFLINHPVGLIICIYSSKLLQRYCTSLWCARIPCSVLEEYTITNNMKNKTNKKTYNYRINVVSRFAWHLIWAIRCCFEHFEPGSIFRAIFPDLFQAWKGGVFHDCHLFNWLQIND